MPNVIRATAALLALSFAMLLPQTASALTIENVAPHLSSKAGVPMTMLNMSRDHQLFLKAYNDYSVLDRPGEVETTYRHSYVYYGYFDPHKCYVYERGRNQFNPSRKTDDRACGGSGEWSGNFLNWASMTRMDIVRKILYGGYRAKDRDTSSETVLERAHLPNDAHAFAKWYKPGANGSDRTDDGENQSIAIRQLTPFDVKEITICNASPPATRPTSSYFSQDSNDLPLIRVVAGDFSLWAGNERFQCYFKEDGVPDFGNNNDPKRTGIKAAPNNPGRADALGTGIAAGDYVARVRVCSGNAEAFTPDEQKRCRIYPSGNAKPIGLLQIYGENDASEFGLMTGSFDKNISGGILRRNISSFAREVNFATDGSFTAEKGIVYNLNRLRIYDYNYTDGRYDGCTFQRIGIGTGGPYAVNEGECSSWGNPIGTMFLEALRYFSADDNPTPAFLAAAGGKDSQLGLTSETWKDPLEQGNEAKYGLPACRKMNIVNFNASVNSYDFDPTKWSGFGNLPGSPSVDSYTNRVGASEDMYDRNDKWLVGNSDRAQDDQCTPKGIGSLASVRGVCPEAPTYSGSYKIAGAALWAQTNPVRTDFPNVKNNPNPKPFRVNTYGVALSTAKPRIEVKVGRANVVIQPTYSLLRADAVGKGTLADFRIVDQTASYGKYIISWEDSEQGGDFDKDIVGILEYRVDGQKIAVTTSIINASSFNPQGFGYIISGTNKDGPHYHSGAYGFDYDDPTNIIDCNDCEASDNATTAHYIATGNVPLVPQDPLFYAAKYGNFHGNYVAGQPLARQQWDRKNTVGQLAPDGLPDAYFFAVEPAELERSLESIFRQFASVGGAAPAVSASRLEAGNKIYYSIYHSDSENTDNYARGELRAYHLDLNAEGNVSITRQAWEAGAKYPTSGNYFRSVRQVITNKGATGTPLTWNEANLTTQQMKMLSISDEFGNVDLLGSSRLDYLRGDRSKEAGSSRPEGFRPRKTILGDIINSGPWYVGVPSAGYTELDNGGYPDFADNNDDRKPMVYVGANDGMLHAYDADTGVEAFSYMPSAVFPDLSKLTRQDYIMQPYVDGPVFAGDAQDGTAWRTFLIGTLGRGGQSVFGLDVTNPQAFRQSNAANLFRWEFTDRNDSDLGHIIGAPTLTSQTAQPRQIVKIKVGSSFRWAVIFGNGYGSDRADGRPGTGRAALYVVFLNKKSNPDNLNNSWRTIGSRGEVEYVKIPMADDQCASVPPPPPEQEDCSGAGPNNGLGVPTPVDTNGDGIVDVIYGADLKGNIWKVKVDGAMSGWPDKSNVKRLYSAKDPKGKAQPISAAVSVIAHPLGGYMVNAVTGRSLQRADFPSTQTQTVYGIWDRPGKTLPIAGRFALQKQLVATTTTADGKYRYGTSVDVDLTKKSGWYVDLPEAGEMGVFDPYVSAGTLIVDTLLQQASADSCTGLTGTIINMFDPITGKTPASTFDRDGDNLFTSSDRIMVDGKEVSMSGSYVQGGVSRSVRLAQRRKEEGGGGGGGPGEPEGKECANKYVITDPEGKTKQVTGYGCAPSGRVYWREVNRNLPYGVK